MLVTFPHMGNLYIVVKVLFEALDIPTLIPPTCTKRTLEIGTKYAPEMACLPMKINIGNFIESIEQGADTIVMAGGCGPCRFGYYGQVQREILKDLGYDVDMIVLEVPDGNIKEFRRRVGKLTNNKSAFSILRAIHQATRVASDLDALDKFSFKVRPRETKKGQTDWIMKKFQHQVLKVKSSKEVLSLIAKTRVEMDKIKIDKNIKPLKVGIVGEIYTAIEPFTNFNIEALLGNMGIEVDRSLNISHWIIEHIIKHALHLRREQSYKKAAKPYMKTMIGGHAQETIGNSVLYAQRGYDGVVQLYPFTCMPEIVAQSILPTVSTDLDIPIITLIIDEMTGEAGYQTRMEAFADMLVRRKERKANQDEYVLYGN